MNALTFLGLVLIAGSVVTCVGPIPEAMHAETVKQRNMAVMQFRHQAEANNVSQ